LTHRLLPANQTQPNTTEHNPTQPNPSSAWREYKERWGADAIADYKTAHTTAPQLLAAAASEPRLAAQLLWTLEVLSDGCAPLAAALKGAGIEVGAGKLLALRTGGGGADEKWCVEVLKAALNKAAK
jgi:hypothetical protein